MAPVRWEDGWPVVSPGTGKVEFSYRAPDLPETIWPSMPARDDFDSSTLAFHWIFLRTPREDFYSLSGRPSHLRLRLRPPCLSEPANPSFVGRRQQHINFRVECAMEFTPQNAQECAGVALIQNNDFHFLFVITKGTEPVLRLIKRANGKEEILAEQPVRAPKLYLKVKAQGQAYSFHFADQPDQWQTLAADVDGRILSTPVAGGFVGAIIAMYASSKGQASINHADFDWFEYTGLE
jgi:alpha-N-arabinofuranosidase